MARFEAWVADCYLGHIERSDKYHCQASIWADSHDVAMHLLAEYLDPQEYRILWVDECQPARLDSRDGSEILTGVHEGQPVLLGPIISTDMTAQAERYLTIEEVEGVEPLDAQFGVWPMKTVPGALHAPLFGQPESTKTEITHYGSVDKVPPMKTYAILDAAKIFGLVEILERSEVRYQCLFKGNAAEEYRDVAPYLVELKEESPFTTILFTHLPDQPEEMTTLHLWHKEPGIYVRSRATFDDVWRHFRKFTRLQDKNGNWFYFRFWEGRMIGELLLSGKTNEKFQKIFFGLRGEIFSFIYNMIDGSTFVAKKRVGMIAPMSLPPLRYEDVNSALKPYAWKNFISRLISEFRKEFKKTHQRRDDTWLFEACNAGKKDGFVIELAIYNYVRSLHAMDIKNANFSLLLRELRKKHPRYSDIELSHLLWAEARAAKKVEPE